MAKQKFKELEPGMFVRVRVPHETGVKHYTARYLRTEFRGGSVVAMVERLDVVDGDISPKIWNAAKPLTHRHIQEHIDPGTAGLVEHLMEKYGEIS